MEKAKLGEGTTRWMLKGVEDAEIVVTAQGQPRSDKTAAGKEDET